MHTIIQKRFIISLLSVPVLMLAASAVAAENHWCIRPYVGADAELRYINFKKGFGDNLFRHNYPQGNLYVGLRLNDYVGIEAGYEATERKTRAVTLMSGAVVNGQALTGNNDFFQFFSTGQIKGPHTNLTGYLPICEQYQLELVGMIGIAYLKSNFLRIRPTINGLPVTLAPRTYIQRKNIMRVGIGIQHLMTKNWGIRATIRWENTNKFNIKSPENLLGSIALKNSLVYGIGAFYEFN